MLADATRSTGFAPQSSSANIYRSMQHSVELSPLSVDTSDLLTSTSVSNKHATIDILKMHAFGLINSFEFQRETARLGLTVNGGQQSTMYDDWTKERTPCDLLKEAEHLTPQMRSFSVMTSPVHFFEPGCQETPSFGLNSHSELETIKNRFVPSSSEHAELSNLYDAWIETGPHITQEQHNKAPPWTETTSIMTSLNYYVKPECHVTSSGLLNYTAQKQPALQTSKERCVPDSSDLSTTYDDCVSGKAGIIREQRGNAQHFSARVQTSSSMTMSATSATYCVEPGCRVTSRGRANSHQVQRETDRKVTATDSSTRSTSSTTHDDWIEDLPLQPASMIRQQEQAVVNAPQREQTSGWTATQNFKTENRVFSWRRKPEPGGCRLNDDSEKERQKSCATEHVAVTITDIREIQNIDVQQSMENEENAPQQPLPVATSVTPQAIVSSRSYLDHDVIEWKSKATSHNDERLTPSEYEFLAKKRLELISMTCPDTEHVQEKENDKDNSMTPATIYQHSSSLITRSSKSAEVAVRSRSLALARKQPDAARNNITLIRKLLDKAAEIRGNASEVVDEEFLSLPVRVSTLPPTIARENRFSTRTKVSFEVPRSDETAQFQRSGPNSRSSNDVIKDHTSKSSKTQQTRDWHEDCLVSSTCPMRLSKSADLLTTSAKSRQTCETTVSCDGVQSNMSSPWQQRRPEQLGDVTGRSPTSTLDEPEPTEKQNPQLTIEEELNSLLDKIKLPYATKSVIFNRSLRDLRRNVSTALTTGPHQLPPSTRDVVSRSAVVHFDNSNIEINNHDNQTKPSSSADLEQSGKLLEHWNNAKDRLNCSAHDATSLKSLFNTTRSRYQSITCSPAYTSGKTDQPFALKSTSFPVPLNDVLSSRKSSQRARSNVDFLITRSGEIIKRPLGGKVGLAEN